MVSPAINRHAALENFKNVAFTFPVYAALFLGVTFNTRLSNESNST